MQGLLYVNHSLVGRPAEFKTNILQLFDKRTVYQHVEQRNQSLGILSIFMFRRQIARFLIQNRKAQEISFEESMELYGDYCRYAEPFETTEQTRMVSNLTITPLFEETKDPAVGAMEKTWYKSADLEKTTGKELANGCTYLSFENLSDTQVKVNFKYTFTYFYPDPDRENYMKEDVTESFLEVTGDMENSVLRFEGSGVMGRIEFFPGYTWLIVEESTDVRFPVGYHCCTEYIPRD